MAGQHEKIEQFAALLKMCKGPGVESCINKALEAPGLFVYGELASLPTMQQLRGTEHEVFLRTLELFAYGTFAEYKGQPDSFLRLTEPQVLKLKQLTLCTLASQQKMLPYPDLVQGLELGNVRSLEDFIIQQCIYSDILKCKLDQVNACVHVHDVLQRDIRPERLSELSRGLNEMLESIKHVSQSLVGNSQRMKQAQDVDKKETADFNNKLQEAKLSIQKAESMQRDQMLHDEAQLAEMGAMAPQYPPQGLASGFFGIRNSNRGTRSTLPDAKRRR